MKRTFPCVAPAVAMACIGITAHAAPVAHYKFDETTGTTLVDSSGNNRNGNVVGTGGSLDVTGPTGSGYRPGSTNDSYGVVANGTTLFGITGNNARTISLWFNTPNFGITNTQYRLFGMGEVGTGSQFDIVAEPVNGANRVGLRYGNGNVYYAADNSGTAFANNTWYHLAVVYDGTTLDLEPVGTPSDGNGLSFYVNGILVNAAGGNLNNGTQALATTATDFWFGRNTAETFGLYPGLLDDVQVYNRALTASDVAALAVAPAPDAVVSSFTADKSYVTDASQVSLSWNASNFDTLVIEPGAIDAAALSTNGTGSTSVTVNTTTTYTSLPPRAR